MKKNPALKWILNTLAAAAMVCFISGCTPAAEESDSSESSSAEGAEGEVVAYTLDTCLVSGEELGSMGDPIVKVYEGTEVKFCCEDCVTEFESEKDKFLAKLTDLQKEMKGAMEAAAGEAEKALEKVLPGAN